MATKKKEKVGDLGPDNFREWAQKAAERALLAARALWAAGWGHPVEVERGPAARDGLAVPWAPTSEELHERAGSPGAVFDLPIGKLCAACLGAGLPQGCQRCARRGGAT